MLNRSHYVVPDFYLERPAMAAMGYDLDREGPKDSENAPNSFLTKTNGFF